MKDLMISPTSDEPEHGSIRKLQPGIDPVTVIGMHAALVAAMTTGLLRYVCAGSPTVEECAAELKLDPHATGYVLEVLAASGLLEREGPRYRHGSATYPASLMGAESLSVFQKQLGHTTHYLTTGEPLPWMDESTLQRESSYSSLVGEMGILFSAGATRLAKQLTLKPRQILDVGCGSGIWSLTIAAESPEARVTGLDFPKVLETFVQRAHTMGLAERVETLSGDMYTLEVPPEKFDLVIIANVLRLEAPEAARKLLLRYAQAVSPGGSLLIVDALAGGSPDKDLLRAVYALLLGVRTVIGRVHPLAQIKSWMTDAGLSAIQDIDLGTQIAALGATIGERAAGSPAT